MNERGLDVDALPVVLRQSLRTKGIAAVVGSWWAFFAGGGGVLVAGRGADSGTGARVLGALIVAGAVPLALYWLLQLVPGSCRLTIAPDGLHVRHAFLPRRLRWEEVDRFYVRENSLGPYFDAWRGVAFTLRRGYRAGILHLLETTLRMRGVFRTDVLPDTYGIGAEGLHSFLNDCDRRWSGEETGPAPRELTATRGVYVLVGVVLFGLAGFFFMGAVGAVAEGAWFGAVVAGVFGGSFAYGLFRLARKWRRPTLRY